MGADEEIEYENTGNHQEKMKDLHKATEENNSLWPVAAEVKNRRSALY